MVADEPPTERMLSELVISVIPEIVDVPAPVIVILPVIEGVFTADPSQAARLTPIVSVTFSVTESRRKIVSPAEASAIAEANVIWLPFAGSVATISLATPNLFREFAWVKAIFFP